MVGSCVSRVSVVEASCVPLPSWRRAPRFRPPPSWSTPSPS